MDPAADVIAMVHREVAAGALEDEDRAVALELRADEEYGRVIPTDLTLVDAFRIRLAEEPTAFSPV